MTEAREFLQTASGEQFWWMDVQCSGAEKICEQVCDIFDLSSRDAYTNVACANKTISNGWQLRERVERDGDGFLIRGREGDVLAKIKVILFRSEF